MNKQSDAILLDEKSKRESQQAFQWLFLNVLYVITANGFVYDQCFRLNKSIWNDGRLWHLIVNKQYLDGSDKTPKTRLMRQCGVGSESSVQRLLSLKADANISSKYVSGQIISDDGSIKLLFSHRTALKIACATNRIQVVELLLAAGANINLAAGARDISDIIEANKHGLNIDWKGSSRYCFLDGDTVLFYACRYRQVDIVKFLLSSGANVQQRNCFGHSALHYSCMTETSHAENETGLTYDSQKEVVIARLLIAAGISPNELSNSGMNPLMEACNSCIPNLAIIKEFITAGTNINCIDETRCTCLMILISNSSQQNTSEIVDIVRELMLAGVNLNHCDRLGRTAFLMAAMYPSTVNTRICDLLISAGVDVNQVDQNGSNALILLCQRYQNLDCDFVRLLFNAGIDVNHADSNGRNALIHLVRERIEDFNDDGDDGQTTNKEFQLERVTLLRLLLEIGVELNHISDDGKTAWRIAHELNLTDVISTFEDLKSLENDGRSTSNIILFKFPSMITSPKLN